MQRLVVPSLLAGCALFFPPRPSSPMTAKTRRRATIAETPSTPVHSRLRSTAMPPTERRRPTPLQLQATPAFIDAVNADPAVSLVVQVGDIHSGKQFCTEAYDRGGRGYVDSLQASADLHARRQRMGRLPQEGRGRRRLQRCHGGDRLRARWRRQPRRLRIRRSGREPRSRAFDLLRQARRALGGENKIVLSQAQTFDSPLSDRCGNTSRT